jgi:hypothetical protein
VLIGVGNLMPLKGFQRVIPLLPALIGGARTLSGT